MEGVPSQAALSALVERYLDRHASTDLEGVLELFAPDAVLEDPVATPPHEGIEAIRAFFVATHRRNGRLAIERVGPVIGCGGEAAAHVRARFVEPPGSPEVDVIYTLVADASGRIARMRAYFIG